MSQVSIKGVVLSQDKPLPALRFVCEVCHRELFGDYRYNFTDREAHRDCRTLDGELYVTVSLTNIHVSN